MAMEGRQPAGSYKFKTDEYLLQKAGGTMLDADWQKKELEGLRSVAKMSQPVSPSRQRQKSSELIRMASDLPAQQVAAYGSGPQRSNKWRTPAALNAHSGEPWDWAFVPKKQVERLEPPPWPEEEKRERELGRTLSSPSTLTFDGMQESMRVLGACQPTAVGERRPSFREPVNPKLHPQTCNQIYGHRAKQAQPAEKYFGKKTCEVGAFVDFAFRNGIQYDASIRF
eukprot:TRINITY_DN32770_c0_g1_i1.p1 TRINITY_DN32770_c0_g1~~TRINITY_DN32770_c0_g1_i1.p1  ORF type:complete len:226 (+),score=38.90 TRINITY_DN32770_c0_g1_i1:56-733(+)